jgi:hypothetical protein
MRFRGAVSAAALVALGLAGRASAEPARWDVSVRTGYAFGVEPRWFEFGDAGWIVGSRQLDRRFGLIAFGGYAGGVDEPVRMAWVPEVSGSTHREAWLVPFGFGLRVAPLAHRVPAPPLSIEAAPTLYWYRYEASLTSTNMFTGATYAAQDHFERLVPGFQLAVVVPLQPVPHLGVDFGVAYWFSAALSPHERYLGSEPFEEGLHTLTWIAGVRLR